MKDFGKPVVGEDLGSRRGKSVELRSKGKAIDAFVLYCSGPEGFASPADSVTYDGKPLLSARVFSDSEEVFAFAESVGSKLERLQIPLGSGRAKFLKRWEKAGRKNKKGLAAVLMLPLAACGGGSGDDTSTGTGDVTSGTIADLIAAVNASTITSTEAVSVTDATGTIAASNLSVVGGATTGAVTVSNAQTITGTAAQVTDALITKGVALGAASTVTVSDAMSVSTAAALAGVANATVGFTSGVTGA
ncbi:hypothetical protein OAP82_10510, partial [Paracoccaceae bacterium]|nr:hypothetical protein [Paracoccaceae bacterium]